MKQTILTPALILIVFLANVSVQAQDVKTDLNEFIALPQVLGHAQTKLTETLEELNYDSSLHPAHTDRNTGKWDTRFLKRNEWTSGFFAGSLWYMYQLTGDTQWKDYAKEWTEDLEPAANLTIDHDTGFRIFSSFGNAFKLIQGQYYHRVLLRAAQTLSRRYDGNIGAIKSWDWIGNFPVIIDNLMNLELLFWASENSGNSEWHQIALAHAETSLQHHMRPDGTSYHIVDFDNSGNVNWKDTRQGYGPNSVWARGQAWAIYGFTMIYRYTGEEKFLNTAIRAADYFIDNLPDDFVPIYDFLEPVTTVQTRDVSASAIAASAFFEIYEYTQTPRYFNSAVNILNSISNEKYLSINSENSSILTQSTLHRGHGNVGTSYADYYFLEAIVRYKKIRQAEFPQLLSQSVFYLDQNFPNPFNNHTQILYTIENDGEVEISVYNSAGRKIRQLVSAYLPAGSYRVEFDASGLSSGTYLYVLRSNGQSVTRTMTLIK